MRRKERRKGRRKGEEEEGWEKERRVLTVCCEVY